MEPTQTNLLRMSKKTVSRLDHVETLLRIYTILADIPMSDTEITVYAYFVIYGAQPSTKELLFSSNVIRSEHTYKNIMYKFKKHELLKKHDKHLHYEIGLDFLKSMSDKIAIAVRLDTGLLITLDNK